MDFRARILQGDNEGMWKDGGWMAEAHVVEVLGLGVADNGILVCRFAHANYVPEMEGKRM